MQDPTTKKKLELLKAHAKAMYELADELLGEGVKQNAKIKGHYESIHGEEHVQKLIDKKLKSASRVK